MRARPKDLAALREQGHKSNRSNNYAATSGDIGEILKRSAAAMSAANTSMEETIALGTAAQTIVQNEEKVGSALSTLSMRIRGSTSELESAGEEVDDYASSTSKLRDEIQALTKVDIMKNSTEYKSMYQILGEISKEWTNLTDVSRANVAEILFGKMRANVGMSILSNFDIAEDVLSKLTNGTADNSAAKEYNTYLDSVAAKQAKLEASFQAFSQSLISSDLVKFNYDAGSGILGFLTSVLEKLGSVPTVVGLAAVALKKFIPETGISIMPRRERNLRWQKSVYAGNMMQGGLATTWSEKTGVNAQRKRLGRGNKKIDQQAYGESLRANRFLLYSAHHGSAGLSCIRSCTLTDCMGLAA